MKKSVVLVSFLLFACSFNTVAGAADAVEEWKYSKAIQLKGEAKYKAVLLDEEVYRYAAGNLSDLRITEDKNEFVPYLVQDGYTSEKQNAITYDSRNVDRFVKDNSTFIDFKVLPVKENADILGSRLVLSMPGKSFMKNIEIYGSYDGVEWKYVVKDSVYKVDHISKTEVVFDEVQKYGYYRIKVPNNLEDINIEKLQVVYGSMEIERGRFIKTAAVQYEIKEEGRETFITFHNENRLKIRQINLTVEGNFNRHFDVYVKNVDAWTPAGFSGDLYSMRFQDIDIRNSSVNFSGSPVASEYIQIKIANRDDKPLDIKKADMEYYVDRLVFEAKSNAACRLLFGNAGAAKPSYDMEAFRVHIEKEPQDLCSLGELVTVQKSAGTEPGKWDLNLVLNMIIILVALVLIGLIAEKLRSKKM